MTNLSTICPGITPIATYNINSRNSLRTLKRRSSSGETYHGQAFTSERYYIDPVGVLFVIDGNLVGRVLPYRGAIILNNENIYSLPLECDPSNF